MIKLEISSLQFILSSNQAVEMAPFIGSTIRGVFGNILKDSCCVEPRGKCSECMLRNRCVYTYLFESGWYFSNGERQQSGVPQPYVFEPTIYDNAEMNPGQAEIKLGLQLFGNSIDYLPVFMHCIKKISQWGLGKNRIAYELERVEDLFGQKQVWHKGSARMIKRPQTKTWDDYRKEAQSKNIIKRCQIELITPLRMKKEGHLQSNLDFTTVIKAIIRRWNLLNKYYGTGEKNDNSEIINSAAAIPSGTLNLHWQEMERYSRRQDQRMMLGGMMGIMECSGELNSFLPWLLLGEDIHIGKNASFGLGKYKLTLM